MRQRFEDSLKDTIKAFNNAIRCSRLRLWVGYFIYLQFVRASSIAYQLLVLIFSSIKETNRLISKGMCVLLFDVLI